MRTKISLRFNWNFVVTKTQGTARMYKRRRVIDRLKIPLN